MTSELNGWVRPRPLRVAFLIQDGEHADLALDGIFADCYDRWGGRFSLIVPCQNGRIAASYWPWLETYDPDIVYSYVPLKRADVLEIHERLSPSEYAFHELGTEPRLDVHGFKPSYKFSPLSSLSVIYRVARYRPTSGQGAQLRIIDSWHTETPTRLLTDNFGTYHISRGGGIYPLDAIPAATLLTIVSPDKQADRRYGIPRDLDAVSNELAAIQEFAEGRATSLSLLSACCAPKLDIRSYPWSEAFNLVVGDTFADRVLFWNARLLIPAWLDADLCCLRVDFKHLKDVDFLSALGNILKHRNHVTGGSGNNTQIIVRSISLNDAQLEEARRLVASTKPWSGIQIKTIGGLDDLVPPNEALQEASEGNHFGGGLFARPDWMRFILSPPTARPPVSAPDHLLEAPIRQSFTQGYWCSDFIFESSGPRPRLTEENRWVLPYRWRMAGAFKISAIHAPQHAIPPVARRSRGGCLGVFVSVDNQVESIHIPSPYEAMQYALTRDGLWFKPDGEHERAFPLNRVSWTKPSNEARYLNGVLGMTGGLIKASNFLLHPFLRDVFAKLGGTPSLQVDRVTPTVNRLRKRARKEASFELSNEGERQALADLIVKAAQSLKSPTVFVSYDELKKQWKEYRKAFWDANPQQNSLDDEVDWDKHEEDSLDDCLIDLRRREIMFQGHRWTCGNCHHKNWVDLGALSSELFCEVCKKTEFAPVNVQWIFRPNEFLISSLRDHSVLSLIWLLSALRERCRSSLIFIGPTWFGFTPESEGPDAEADLLAVLDGKAVLCEAKASWHSLRPSHITDFVNLALRLRPDTALLAVMEDGPEPEYLEAACAVLTTQGITFELLTTKNFQFDHDPYLHSEN